MDGRGNISSNGVYLAYVINVFRLLARNHWPWRRIDNFYSIKIKTIGFRLLIMLTKFVCGCKIYICQLSATPDVLIRSKVQKTVLQRA